MITFIIGLVILFVGAAVYGAICEKVFGPDDRQTPAYSKQDGVDYVPMPKWKNMLINLLNIAGTGPIFGPIQGILFGPIAFITIPIGNIIGGAMHDYFSGMICLRDGGSQMSSMIHKYSNKGIYRIYNVFVCLLLLLVGAVFIYTPGDIAATGIFGFDGAATSVSTWVIYGAIFVYYLIATVFPIDAIIGKIYPIFGAILLFSAVGVFAGLFVKGYPLLNLWDNWQAPAFAAFQTAADGSTAAFSYGEYFANGHFLPVFFVTVACGILSGFHSTQTAIISRTVKSEKEGRMTFYNMMVLEGFIAMVWAGAAMGIFNAGLQAANAGATSTVIKVCKDILGPVGGVIALVGIVVLPITSGDTALRGLRLTVAETLHIDQSTKGKPEPVRRHLRPGGRDPGVRQVQQRGLPDPVALLCLVQPDPVPVRLPGHHGMDVRERQGQVRLDAHDPRRLLLLHLLHLHRQCQDRLQHPLDLCLYHRRCGRCGLCGRHHLVWPQARRRPYPPALIQHWILFRSGPVSGSAPLPSAGPCVPLRSVV